MATEDFMQHPIVWVIIVLIFAGIFGSIGFLILGEVDEVVVESGVIQESSDCIVYNVTEIGEESLGDPDCGLDSSDFLKTIFFNEVNEYNCTADPWASIERTEENCTCGCDNALYRLLVSWWEEGEMPDADWADPCIIYTDYQWFGPPEEDYTCDCGCEEDDQGPWMDAVGVYDWNETNETYDYNYTICYSYDDMMLYYYWDEANGTFIFQTACNISAFYNVSEDDICEYTNVTSYYWDTETHCNGTEDCGCEEGDDWWEGWSTQFWYEWCDNWNQTNCTCDGNLTWNMSCVDSDYTWYSFDWYTEGDCEEGAGNLTIATACNNNELEWEYIEEVYCFNETNWDPEEPPWNYTTDLWFSSSCIEENSTVIAYDDYTNESDTYTFSSYYEGTWSQSYSDVVGGLGGGFSLYSLIPLMTIISIVIGLLVGAFYFKKND